MLIEIKVKTVRIMDGKARKKIETYLIDKEFFSEAEYAIVQELTEEQNSKLVEEFDITALKQSPIKEICTQYEGEASFVATLRDVWLDTDGTEKYLRYKVLLYADNLTEANTRIQQLAKQGYDMLIESIKQVDYIYLNNQNTNGVS